MKNIDRDIWRLTWPNVLSNITVPILGMVDTAIAGYVGGDTQIGAVSIGTTIFNFIYMNCSFLRMGTTGLTAQAYGARNTSETTALLTRALLIALTISIILIALKAPLADWATAIMGGSADIQTQVHQYVQMRIFAIPAAVSLFAFNGWFIGMQDAKTPMVISIVANIVNIASSLLFAIHLSMGIQGIALGTVLSQYVSLTMAVAIYIHHYRPHIITDLRQSLEWQGLKKFFIVNRDLMLRNICIVLTYTMFTRFSAQIGDIELATNALLMQLFTLYSYMFDGVAYAAEALTGRYIGERNTTMFRLTAKRLFLWAMSVAVLYVIIYITLGQQILSLFSPSQAVMQCATDNMAYIIAVPLVSFIPYMIDGIMFGATHTTPLRNSMFISTLTFHLMAYWLIPLWGNDALWAAFITFTTMRGILLAQPMKRLYESNTSVIPS